MSAGVVLIMTELAGAYAVCLVSPAEPSPAWAEGEGFLSISRGEDELTVVCRAERVPDAVTASRNWCAFRLEGAHDFDAPGILLAALKPVSENGIGIFAVSTFHRDCVMVQHGDREAAIEHWRAAGHSVAERA